jgi:hypothetical protein
MWTDNFLYRRRVLADPQAGNSRALSTGKQFDQKPLVSSTMNGSPLDGLPDFLVP